MSRTDDYGLTDSERRDKSPSVFDRMAELPSRLGLSREAAEWKWNGFAGWRSMKYGRSLGNGARSNSLLQTQNRENPDTKNGPEPAGCQSRSPAPAERCRSRRGKPVPSRMPMDERQPAQTETELHD